MIYEHVLTPPLLSPIQSAMKASTENGSSGSCQRCNKLHWLFWHKRSHKSGERSDYLWLIYRIGIHIHTSLSVIFHTIFIIQCGTKRPYSKYKSSHSRYPCYVIITKRWYIISFGWVVSYIFIILPVNFTPYPSASHLFYWYWCKRGFWAIVPAPAKLPWNI